LIECFDCLARGQICDTHEEAVAAWNRRSPVVGTTDGGGE
jgi:hypothetical protein